MLKIKLANSL